MLDLAGTKNQLRRQGTTKTHTPTKKTLKKEEDIDEILPDTQCCSIPCRTSQPSLAEMRTPPEPGSKVQPLHGRFN